MKFKYLILPFLALTLITITISYTYVYKVQHPSSIENQDVRNFNKHPQTP